MYNVQSILPKQKKLCLNLEPIWDKNDASISGTASLKLLCCTVALFYSARPIGKGFSLSTKTFACLQTGGWISPTGRAMLGQEFSEPHNPPVSIEKCGAGRMMRNSLQLVVCEHSYCKILAEPQSLSVDLLRNYIVR